MPATYALDLIRSSPTSLSSSFSLPSPVRLHRRIHAADAGISEDHLAPTGLRSASSPLASPNPDSTMVQPRVRPSLSNLTPRPLALTHHRFNAPVPLPTVTLAHHAYKSSLALWFSLLAGEFVNHHLPLVLLPRKPSSHQTFIPLWFWFHRSLSLVSRPKKRPPPIILSCAQYPEPKKKKNLLSSLGLVRYFPQKQKKTSLVGSLSRRGNQTLSSPKIQSPSSLCGSLLRTPNPISRVLRSISLVSSPKTVTTPFPHHPLGWFSFSPNQNQNTALQALILLSSCRENPTHPPASKSPTTSKPGAPLVPLGRHTKGSWILHPQHQNQAASPVTMELDSIALP